MKNIHILPTDKPSRFQKTKHDNFFLASKIELYTDCIAQHIYITSDEEIKDRDWTFDGENPYKWTKDDVEDCLYNLGSENYKGCKKIILTTDEDLIKDGVQAIDDEFLEWFVKNPSCEGVVVEESILLNTSRTYLGVDKYKIIIPSIDINSLKKQD